MSGGFRGGSHGVRRNTDAPLIKLVEQYLLQYKHLSFINLDNMGDVIKKHSFRYSRMKDSVFKEQLRRAYEQYSDTANKSLEEFSGENIELDDTPLTDETLKEMEGYPSEVDSDVEIDQESMNNIGKDAGVDQMKSLYKATPTNSGTTNNGCGLDGNVLVSGNGEGVSFEGEKASNETQGVNADKSDCISICSSTDFSSKSENPKAKSVPTAATQHFDHNDRTMGGSDSESDLEIIEEVPNDRLQTSVITNNTNGCRRSVSMSITGRTVVEESQANVSSVRKETINESANVISISKVGDGSAHRTFPVKNLNIPSRGVKRKPVGSIENEAFGGINEDLFRKKPRKEVAVIHDNGYKLQDFAGSDKVVEEVCKLLMHLKHPEVYQTLGVTPPRGFLLHGPPGTGKTLLANAIAGELQIPMLKIAGTELVSGISGESENNIRDLFNQAVSVAPCVVFIDEIDSVTPRRETVNKDMERRIVAQLLSCIDDLASKEKGNQVLLIGATNRIEAIDTALRRAGRFDREICLGIPDEKAREKILNVICRGLKLEPEFNIKTLSKLTPGYVGADLQALIREAAVQAVNRKLLEHENTGNVVETTSTTTKKNNSTNLETSEEMENQHTVVEGPASMEVDGEPNAATRTDNENVTDKDSQSIPAKNQCQFTQRSPNLTDDLVLNPLRWINELTPLSAEKLQNLFVTMADFHFALKNVQPSSKREGFATVPDTTWEDIGALHSIRDELQVSILGPVKHTEAFKALGLTTPAGVLLCGPPGCGKTLLAKAVANEAGINFISVKGPELLNMYVGESERAVRQCFLRARNSSPCVIFFDELDALCPRRSDVADSGSSGRIVNQLLTEMDGMEGRQGVFIMAASNRPDIIDPAVLRPGRLDKILFVNLPTPSDRFEILKTITKMSTKPLLADDVNLEELASSPQCDDYTGADLAALVREASIASFREHVLEDKSYDANSGITKELKVYQRHFNIAFTKTKPSVGKDDRMKYKMMAEKYSTIR